MKGFLKNIGRSFTYQLGRFLFWFVLAMILFLIFGSKANAMTYETFNQAMGTQYYDYFKNVVGSSSKDYTAFSYQCQYPASYGTRVGTCYALCIGDLDKQGQRIFGKCDTVYKFTYQEYSSGSSSTYGLLLSTESDQNFSSNGFLQYSNLMDSSMETERGAIYAKTILTTICICFSCWIISHFFARKG